MLIRHRRKAERRSDYVRGTRLVPCIYSEAPQTSLPLKALPYWHFFDTTLLKARGNDSFFSSARTIWHYLFLFLSLVSVLPPNLKKAAFKRQTVKTLYGLQTLYLKMEVNLKCWNEVYLLKIFYWGSERDLEQSTVYVTYLIQESRSLDKPCFRTSRSTEKCSKQPTKLLYWFHLYCMEIKTNLLGLWFTVLVCTRCCLQKKVGKKKI